MKALVAPCFYALLSMSTLSSAAMAAAPTTSGRAASIVVDAEAARNRASEIAQTMMAEINSEQKLAAYLNNAAAKKSPLLFLSAPARQRFIESLSFNHNGLSGFRFDDLEAELTFSQAYKLLQLFGAQDRVFTLDLAVKTEEDTRLFAIVAESATQVRDDHREYKCVDRFNCYTAMSYICMSGCSPILIP